MTLKETFDNESKFYDEFIVKTVPYYATIIKEASNLLPYKNDAEIDILDVGIGTGNFEVELFSRYKSVRVDGIDVSENMLTVAKEKKFVKNANINFIAADVLNFVPQNNKRYDLVVMSLLLHNFDGVEEKTRVLRNTISLLKAGGFLLLIDLIKFSNIVIQTKVTEEYNQFLHHANGVTEGENWRQLLEKEDKPETIETLTEITQQLGLSQPTILCQKLNFSAMLFRFP